MTRWLILAAALIWLALLLLYPPARAGAQEHIHPGKVVTGEVGKFYSKWDRMDMPGASCCSLNDCYATPARQIGGIWFALRREDEKWLTVPASKVEDRYDSPDGLSHLCAPPPGPIDTIFCFLPAGGA